MDTLGCCFVGTITALGGGTVRDLLLGRVPVFWFKETSFLGLSIVTCLGTFFGSESLESAGLLREQALFVGDTIGLGAFAIVGAQAAITSGSSAAVASVCGMLTATCGGLVRDVLCSRKNQGILYSGENQGSLYAPTALTGAALYATLSKHSRFSQPIATMIGVGATIAMRALAYQYSVKLPAMPRFISAERQSEPQPSLLLSQAHLFVTAYGPDGLGHVARISRCITQARANVSASKILTIGDDIAFMMVVSVPSDVVDSLAKALKATGTERGLIVNTSRIENVAGEEADGPSWRMRRRHSRQWRLRLDVFATDSPGVMAMVASFLEEHHFNIQSLDSRVYSGTGEAAEPIKEPPPAHDAARAEARPPRTRQLQSHLSESAETGKSRNLRARDEGDQFCLSAIVTTDHAPDEAMILRRKEALERKHNVQIKLRWLTENGTPVGAGAAPEL